MRRRLHTNAVSMHHNAQQKVLTNVCSYTSPNGRMGMADIGISAEYFILKFINVYLLVRQRHHNRYLSILDLYTGTYLILIMINVFFLNFICD